MPLNISTNGDASKISFGPATVLVGAVGATPTVDVGYVGEDGTSVEMTSEVGTIMQGNPKIPIKTFIQSVAATVSVSGIEWNFDHFASALGAGETTASPTLETFEWGGDPCPDEISLLVEHQLCSGQTLAVSLWRAVGQGNMVLPINHDVHNFAYAWSGLQSTTRWDGSSTPTTAQLIRVEKHLP